MINIELDISEDVKQAKWNMQASYVTHLQWEFGILLKKYLECNICIWTELIYYIPTETVSSIALKRILSSKCIPTNQNISF